MSAVRWVHTHIHTVVHTVLATAGRKEVLNGIKWTQSVLNDGILALQKREVQL